MNLIENLRESVKRTTGLEMHYQSIEELNRIMDVVDMPCAYAFLIESAGLTLENGRAKERVTIEVCFTDLTEFDFNSWGNEDILDDCKKNAIKFLMGMQNDPYFKLVSVNGSDRVYERRYDNPMTAFCVNITIEELIGVGECDF